MNTLIVPASSPAATNAEVFGPKAANLAALGQAGLPIPEGYCLSADAYRLQVRALGLEATARGVFGADDGPQARRHALNAGTTDGGWYATTRLRPAAFAA